MKKTLSTLFNKYLLAIFFLVAWILFFDETDFFLQQHRLADLQSLQQKVTYYKNEIELAKQELNDFKTNPETLEKYAREKYFMKKNNEDLFIIDNSH